MASECIIPHKDRVLCCTFSPDAILVTGSYDGSIELWDPLTGMSTRSPARHVSSVFNCALSHDGVFLATVGANGLTTVWNIRTGTRLYTLDYASVGLCCAFSANGLFVITGLHDHTLRIWPMSNGDSVRSLSGHTSRSGHTKSVQCCAYSSDSLLIVSGSWDCTAKLWDPRDGTCVRTFQGHYSGVVSCAFSPDDMLIATASIDQTAKIWEVRTGRCVHTLCGHTNNVYDCAFACDGVILATTSDDCTARLWNVRTGSCVHVFEGHGRSVVCCDFSPDGSLLATGSVDCTARIWHVPHQLRPRVKVLLMVMIGNRAGYHRLWLPAELWQWMDEQGFY